MSIRKLGRALTLASLASAALAVGMALLAFFLTKEKGHVIEALIFLIALAVVLKIRI